MPARLSKKSKNGEVKGAKTKDPLDAEAKNRIHQLLDNVREQVSAKHKD